jgi:hypothetical protein
MRIDAHTVRTIATPGAAGDAMPEHVFGGRAGRWVPLLATVLAATTAVLVASGLAVVMNLS